MSYVYKLPQTVYCEGEISQFFSAEPINVISNSIFFLVAFLAFKFLKNKKVKDRQLLLLPWLLFSVGVGSLIYHTHQNSITLLFDAIPIYIFIFYTFTLMLRSIFKKKITMIYLLSVILLIEIAVTILVPKELLNGSIRHLVTFVFVMLIGWIALKKFGTQILSSLLVLLILYALAILFRSIDMVVCSVFPLGTHFLWHISTAFAGYQALVLLSAITPKKK